MYDHNISRHIYIDVAMAPVAAGTGDTQNGIVIDTAGYEAVLFLLYVGAIVSGGSATLQVQYGTQANGSDMANVPVPTIPETYNTSGSSAVSIPATGASEGWLSVELHRPTKRYVRIAVTRTAQNVTLNGAFVLMAKGTLQPPVQGLTMGNVTPQVIVSP
jgi:hypothetical protein